MSANIVLHIRVQHVNFRVTLSALSSLSDLKNAVQQEAGIPAWYQRIRKGNVELSSAFDNHLLQDLGVQGGDTLHVSILEGEQRAAVDTTEKIYQHLKVMDALVRSLRKDNTLLKNEVVRLRQEVEEGRRREQETERRERMAQHPAFPTFPSAIGGRRGPQVPVKEGNASDMMAMLGNTFGPPSIFEQPFSPRSAEEDGEGHREVR